MRLAEFITRHLEGILAEWESFATTLLPAASNLSSLALRDRAQQILEAVALDLTTPQTRDEYSTGPDGMMRFWDFVALRCHRAGELVRLMGEVGIMRGFTQVASVFAIALGARLFASGAYLAPQDYRTHSAELARYSDQQSESDLLLSFAMRGFLTLGGLGVFVPWINALAKPSPGERTWH